jgi:5'-nucleotidase
MPGEIVRILHTNDLHGTLDDRRQAILATARAHHDLYFDTGDCIKTGNLGVPLGPEPVWPRLASLKCTASVPGNRESHVLKSTFEAKLAGHTHSILCANLYDRAGERVLPPNCIIEASSLSIGIFGVMVPMVTSQMRTQSLSQLLWTPAISEAAHQVAELGEKCDLVIALTHIGVRQDRELANMVKGIDLILGGHSHSLLNPPERIGDTWICQAASHGKFYGSYEWTSGIGLTACQILPF